MFAYAIRRLLGAIPTLFIIVTLSFFMMRIAPGGPFDSQRRLPPEIEHNIKAAYNLDKPVWQQYAIYLGKLAHGDLGPSYKNKDFTVNELIADGLPVSAMLGLSAMALAVLFGTVLGTFRGAAPEPGVRLRLDVAGDDRHHHSHLRHRADPDADLRRLWRDPVRLRPVAAGGRLERRRAAQHDPADLRPGAAADRLYRAHHPAAAWWKCCTPTTSARRAPRACRISAS
ncbi:MAG: hypothetical protein WDM81_03095 [Rhizomicrobium sp.]